MKGGIEIKLKALVSLLYIERYTKEIEVGWDVPSREIDCEFKRQKF